MNKINDYFGLVKFSHTIFAMPFALTGYFMGAAEVGFSWLLLVQVVACMVLARTAAMAFNRLVDRKFDAMNPRTSAREIPAGRVSVGAARCLVVGCALCFVAVCATINMLCLVLAPVALLVVLGYSYAKRFTSLCHLILGLGLAIAPVGAYIAVTGSFAAAPLILSGLVFTWVAGFDVIFALQDVMFDRSANLRSIPASVGVCGGLVISAVLHLLTVAAVVAIGVCYINNVWYWIGAAAFTGLLVFQHLIVKPTDLSRVGLAFGTTNGVASIVFALFTIVSFFAAR